jgi:ABC-type branched-subunit amino acid transport system substrate-binding protein
VLGGRLAEALAEVHGAGLVHRDVKPGNVLLALDGPRLIDFGIARPAGASALTATGVVVGSPGYLAPEQAEARGADIGPPSDIFALGCVLAHAAGGRRPFGGGAVAAVLYRTVHAAPELDGVPEPLLPLLRRCLEKDPAARPTAAELRAELDGPDPPGGWLPAAVPGLIAERSAAALRFPADGPVRADRSTADRSTEHPAGDTRPPPTRRRALAVLAGAVGVAAAGGVTFALARRGASTAAPPASALPRRVLGLHADLTGPGAAEGEAQERGARLAVAELAAHPDRAYDLALEVWDDASDPARAAEAAAHLAGTAGALAVLGPTTAAAALAALPGYQEQRLPMATVSVATEEISDAKHGVWFSLRPVGTAAVTLPVIGYLTLATASRSTLIVEDLAAPADVRAVVRRLAATPPSEGTAARHAVPADSEDFAPAAEAAVSGGADAVVLVTDDPGRAARCARALRRAGYRGPRLGLAAALEDRFAGQAAGDAGGWVYSTAYTDPAADPRCQDFAAAYRDRYGTEDIPHQAAEAYDAVRFLAAGLDAVGARATADREGRNTLRLRLRKLVHEGITRTIGFDQHTRAFDLTNGTGLFLYRIEDGAARLLGRYNEAEPSWHGGSW